MKNKNFLPLLNHYTNLWGLTECCKIASTFTSDVYKAKSKHGSVILKILNDIGRKDESAGIYFLANCNGNGAAKLFEYDDQALLMEYLPGNDLCQFSKSGNENRASEIFCSIIKKIKSIKPIKYQNQLTPYTKLFDFFDRIPPPNRT